jgi:hypothetical protein
VYCCAVGSRSIDKAEEFSAAFSGERKIKPFGSYIEAINIEEASGVYIGLPTGVAEQIIFKCLEAGKHVFADKPFLNVDSLKKIKDFGDKRGLFIMDGTTFVHNLKFKEMQEMVQKGAIGDLRIVIANFFAGKRPEGSIRLNPELEPLGVIGDLGRVSSNQLFNSQFFFTGWHCARAATEFLFLDDTIPVEIENAVVDNYYTGDSAIWSSSSIVKFGDGRRFVCNVGYEGSLEHGLVLVGTKGVMKVQNFTSVHFFFSFFFIFF